MCGARTQSHYPQNNNDRGTVGVRGPASASLRGLCGREASPHIVGKAARALRSQMLHVICTDCAIVKRITSGITQRCLLYSS